MIRTIRLSAAAILAVTISTAFVCLIGLAGASITAGMQRAVRTAIADAAVVVTPAPGQQFIPGDVAAAIADAEGVDSLTGQVFAVVQNQNGTAVAIQSLPADQITLTQGRLPDAEGEVVLAPVAAKPISATIGSRVEIQGAAGPHILTVVGIAAAQPGALENSSVPTLLGSISDVQAWTGQNGFTRLLISTTRSPEQLAATLADLPSVGDQYLRIDTGDSFIAGHAPDYASGVRTLTTGMQLMGLISLIAAFVVIANTFTIKLAQRARELALLRCLGASRHQVFGSMVIEGLVTGLIGAAAGVAIAHLLAIAVIGRLAVGLQLSFEPSAKAVIVSLAAGLLATGLAVLRPARQATRIAPLQALRAAAPDPDVQPSRGRIIAGIVLAIVGLALVVVAGLVHSIPVAVSGGAISLIGPLLAAPGLFPAVASRIARVAGHSAAQAAENLKLNPRRTGATAIAVWFGATLVTAVIVGAATASATLVQTIDESSPTDIIVTPAGEPLGLATQLAALPQVSASVPVDSVMLQATFGDQQQLLTIAAWNPELPGALRHPDGAPEPAAGTIQLPASSGVSDGAAVQLVLGQTRVGLRAVVVPDAPGIGLVDEADYAALGRQAPPDIWVKLVPGAHEQATLETIAAIAGPDAWLSSPAVQRANIDDTLATATRAATGLLAITVLIALIGVSNTLSLSVIERTREFGLLRALGALRRQIRRLIAIEALLTTSIATLLGIVFGVIYGIGGVGTMLATEQLRVVPSVPWAALLAVLVGSVLCALLAAVFPAQRAARVPPVAALGNASN